MIAYCLSDTFLFQCFPNPKIYLGNISGGSQGGYLGIDPHAYITSGWVLPKNKNR